MRELITSIDASRLAKLEEYVDMRLQQGISPCNVTVLVDLTYQCNLNCIGCGVDAHFCEAQPLGVAGEIGTEQVVLVLKKVGDYLSFHRNTVGTGAFSFKVCFGGGEPILRSDLFEILDAASALFGMKNLTLDTNGTLTDPQAIDALIGHVGCIGVGLDGNKKYHNWWRNPTKEHSVRDPYECTMEFVRGVCSRGVGKEKIEITFLPTKMNLTMFREVVEEATSLGVRKFSVHRCMPTGRMSEHIDLMPEISDYIDLAIAALDLAKEFSAEVHLHHSIETMLTALLCPDAEIPWQQVLCPVPRSAVTVDAHGGVHYCPWLVSEKRCVPNLSQTDGLALVEAVARVADMARRGGIIVAGEGFDDSFQRLQRMSYCPILEPPSKMDSQDEKRS
jgi:MoaA/NifB/PqqE/SkfB family radical SAM enzyme